jgi:hypothetical protein
MFAISLGFASRSWWLEHMTEDLHQLENVYEIMSANEELLDRLKHSNKRIKTL